MASSGITINNGATNKNLSEVQLKNKICQKANQVYILADHNKFNVTSVMTFWELKDIDILFTDKELETEYEEYFKKYNVKTIIANP